MPKPTKEHAWLERFVGVWDAEIEMTMGPDEPPSVVHGTDVSEMLGGFWLVSEGRNNEFPYKCRLTLGYDTEKKKYVGTWVDTMSSYLWNYEGTVDKSGRILTLDTEGPFPPIPGSWAKIREITEFKSDDHRVFTSSRLDESGEWLTHMKINFRRKS